MIKQARSVVLLGGTLQPFHYIKSFLFPHVGQSNLTGASQISQSASSAQQLRLFTCGHVVDRANVAPIVVSDSNDNIQPYINVIIPLLITTTLLYIHSFPLTTPLSLSPRPLIFPLYPTFISSPSLLHLSPLAFLIVYSVDGTGTIPHLPLISLSPLPLTFFSLLFLVVYS